MSLLDQAQSVPKIQVVVRKRPLTQKEIKKGDIDIVRVLDEQNLVLSEEK